MIEKRVSWENEEGNEIKACDRISSYKGNAT